MHTWYRQYCTKMECIRRRLHFASFTFTVTLAQHFQEAERRFYWHFSASLFGTRISSNKHDSSSESEVKKIYSHFTYWNYTLPCSLTGEHFACANESVGWCSFGFSFCIEKRDIYFYAFSWRVMISRKLQKMKLFTYTHTLQSAFRADENFQR